MKTVLNKILKNTTSYYMDYEEVCNALTSVSKLGSRPGLKNINRLCELLGNPQDRLSFVHTAGTNGKGSTCTMIANILKEAGYSTGLYLSPYLNDYRDSFFIDGSNISIEDFSVVVSYVYRQAKKMEQEGLFATEFEILTAAAFVWFDKSKCDIVVLEAGMGGRLDATNIVKNTLVSVITSIALDHTDFLGDTIEKIAWEKCGIIKNESITVCYPQQELNVLKIIEKNTEEKHSHFIVPEVTGLKIIHSDIEGTDFIYRGENIHVSLSGSHQTINAITAIETANALRERHGYLISDSAIKKGISSAYLPARQEILNRHPLILLDGAHNLQGIKALAGFINTELKHQDIVVIMGMLKDKQYEQSIEAMAKLCKEFIIVPPDNPRSWDVKIAYEIASTYCKKVAAYNDVYTAVKEAVMFCSDNRAVVICGSLYLACKAKEAVTRLKQTLENRS